MKIAVRVKLIPEAVQAAALASTLTAVNDAANHVSQVAFENSVPREYELRRRTYAELKSRGLGAQAAQHVIKKTRDAYTALEASIRAGNLGRPGSKRRVRAESKPIVFRPDAAQPYDDLRVRTYRPEQPPVPGRVRVPRLRRHNARGRQRVPQHRPQRRGCVGSGA